mgnify:CR=1 FL=1
MITTINQLERTTADDVVTTVHWNASEVDGEHSARSYGSQSFTRDADSPELIPFADLTEETVVGWLTLDEGLEANLLAQIEEQKNPTSTTGLAW